LGISSSQVAFIFFRGVGIPPTRSYKRRSTSDRTYYIILNPYKSISYHINPYYTIIPILLNNKNILWFVHGQGNNTIVPYWGIAIENGVIKHGRKIPEENVDIDVKGKTMELKHIWLVVWNMNYIFPYAGNSNPN